jgi:monoamine oxidase
MQDHFDVAIVGAGAAGIAAARRLADAPLDAGCGWLHSADRNVLATLLEKAGVALDRTPPHWTRQSGDAHFSAADQRAFRRAYDAFEARLEQAATAGEDAAAARFFDPDCRWNPLMDAVSAYYNGAAYDQVSVLDYAAYEDTEVNWRVREGYGAAIANLAVPDRIVLDCAVETIDHGGTPIRIATSKGALSAQTLICTAPTPILAEGRIDFRPALPQKVEAAAGLPLGLADKAFLRLAAPEDWPEEGHLFGRTDRTETASYHLRPFGRPYIEVYLGGRHARMLEEDGAGAMTAFALEELVGLRGSDIRRTLSPIAETAWARDPWSSGSYSHALPGHAGARAVLAAPVEERLFFAGEATHPSFYSTAHGAWESGVRAADEVIAALKIRAA